VNTCSGFNLSVQLQSFFIDKIFKNSLQSRTIPLVPQTTRTSRAGVQGPIWVRSVAIEIDNGPTKRFEATRQGRKMGKEREEHRTTINDDARDRL